MKEEYDVIKISSSNVNLKVRIYSIHYLSYYDTYAKKLFNSFKDIVYNF